MSGFAWVPGSPFVGDPDEVQAEIMRLRNTVGATPASVVVAARSERSVLHRHIFHIPAEEAAEKYYLYRANALLVAIVVRDEQGDPTPVRANVRVVTDRGAEYVAITEAGAAEAALARLKRDMRALQRQLRALELFPHVIAVLEEALAE